MDKDKSWPSGRELEVLRLLQSAGKGMYGMELVEKSRGLVDRTTVYVYLSRLEDKGFVDVTRPKTGKHPGMQRPIYKINGLGVRAIDAAEIMGMLGARARS
jgi:DNA-binding PadR family transcriptional regulator